MDSQFAPQQDVDNMVDSDNVTINGFMFCARHGLELCNKCPTDNRGANNMIVEDGLHEKLSEEEYNTKWQGDDREPFSVAHQWTRVSNGKPACMEHKEVGCKECFDWGEKLYRGIHGHRKQRQSRLHKKDKHPHDESQKEKVMH
ncbi:uncharacterized protein BX664DRAFT_335498 [Halteromyces radiatus]|uniref:uncharacterized protein n=1 Tax=Halteromyces radiatus TaxID=101107 RepID=UPI00221F8E70|nr:uncharacterized protein BX664DRAFT_335498 [Halteromyces radiatus]KAI8086311.1 hypothetical protein BX664DRAFT_335498 [Halteromyces radiatus]